MISGTMICGTETGNSFFIFLMKTIATECNKRFIKACWELVNKKIINQTGFQKTTQFKHLYT